MQSQVFGVTSDDELAQTWEAEVEALGSTLDNADRILAAARELDKKLIAEAFSDAHRTANAGSGSMALDPVDPRPVAASAEGHVEVSRLRMELEQARLDAQENQKARTEAEQELAAAQASVRNERDRVRVMEAELQEERTKIEVECRRRDTLLRRIDELEELADQNAASLQNRDPAGPGGTHGEASGSPSRGPGTETAATERISEEFSKLDDLFGRLEKTLAELDDQSQKLSHFVEKDSSSESHSEDGPKAGSASESFSMDAPKTGSFQFM
mmetsp:Transcript_86940/g.153724  ORF Transcript_86940/g.153724 Transcript_86940/m.153724 type:complete len:271 (-) Transcript_86940:19-831(-)